MRDVCQDAGRKGRKTGFQPAHYIATFLDPAFKPFPVEGDILDWSDGGFPDKKDIDQVKKEIKILLMHGVSPDMATEAAAGATKENEEDDDDDDDEEEEEEEINDAFAKRVSGRKRKKGRPSPSSTSSVEDIIDEELKIYLQLDPIAFTYPDKIDDAFGKHLQLIGERRKGEALNPSFYPLDWWKVNQVHFPYLSRLARRTLAIPASSAATERLFSHTGNILTSTRTRLHDNIFAAILLNHDSYEIVKTLRDDLTKLNDVGKRENTLNANSIRNGAKKRRSSK